MPKNRTTEDLDVDAWLASPDDEGKDDTGTPSRGRIVNKSELSRITGLAIATIDRCLADGAPLIGKGSRKQGWRINTAEFFIWYCARKVDEATNDPNVASFEIAKRREKTAQAEMREMESAKMRGETVSIADVIEVYKGELAVVRSRLLAAPTRLAGEVLNCATPEEAAEMIRAEIFDAMAELTGKDLTEQPAGEEDDGEPQSETDSEDFG